MQHLLDLPRTWTFAALQQALPDNADWRRYEIVDGTLVVSPSPGSMHELVLAGVRESVAHALPVGFSAVGSLGIDLGRSYRIPDMVVARTDTLLSDTTLLPPEAVQLAVEIVSPSSRTTDRVTKPAEYAAAGIPAYWRVETDPDLSLTAYLLPRGGSAYCELGNWAHDELARIDQPFPAVIDVATLIPAR